LLGSGNTFTIVTAHQPSLLTGPLYYVYKIASTINLCARLKEHYPDYHFVPVFINGSEDHDFEEINHVNLFHKTIYWEEEKRGPVGRLPLGELETVIQEVGEILGSSTYADEVRSLLKESLANSKTYNDFAAHLVQFLFAPYGVVSLNTDDHRLKKIFVPIIKKEIFSSFSISHIEKAQSALEEKGFKGQAYPRDINFFYLGDGYRERIEKDGDSFKVLNTDIEFSANALEKEIEEHPERFSPNVIMRPLYQELILPNLAYIGGGGELAYWLERKSQFEEAGIPFPMLIRRNSVLLLASGHQKSMDKLEIDRDEIWEEEYLLINKILENASDVDLNVDTEYEAISQAMEAISKRALEIDPGLEKYVLAERAKTLKISIKLDQG
jgi:bacillithiol biosynthesis cysteine-adding enzyme BshC